MIPSFPTPDPDSTPSSDILALVKKIAEHPSVKGFFIVTLIEDDNPIALAGGAGARNMACLAGLVGATQQQLLSEIVVTRPAHGFLPPNASQADVADLLSKLLTPKKKDNPSPDPSDE